MTAFRLLSAVRAAVPDTWSYERAEGGHAHVWIEPGGERGVTVEPHIAVVEGWASYRPILMRGVDDRWVGEVLAALRGFGVLPGPAAREVPARSDPVVEVFGRTGRVRLLLWAALTAAVLVAAAWLGGDRW